VFQKGDTIRFLDASKSTIERQYIIPFTLHSSWKYDNPGLSIGSVTVDTQANISVNSIYYNNAFQIAGYGGMPDAGFSVDEWFENNIGLVKSYSQSGGISGIKDFTRWSLISYHLK